MILRDRDFAFGQGLHRASAVKPCGRNEPRDRKAGHVFEKRPAGLNSRFCLISRQAQELTFAGRHPLRAQPVGNAVMPRKVAMIETVKKDFEPGFGPSAQPARERRPRKDRRLVPMIWNDQESDAIAYLRRQKVDKPFDLALEPRRDVVDRCEEAPSGHQPSTVAS